MHGAYNPYLVALSLVVAGLASYTILDLADRIRRLDAADPKKKFWLLAGAAAMGTGIWSMHFVGMLACQMPMEISYDPWITALSLLIAIAIGHLALQWTTRSELNWKQITAGAAFMGTGIVAMHYVGMAAIRVTPAIEYRRLPFLASIVIALVASWAALWIAFTLRDEDALRIVLKRSGAAIVMGHAIAGMHYVAMSAAVFSPIAVFHNEGGISHSLLVVLATGLSLCSLTMILIVSRLDSRFDQLVLLSNLSRSEVDVDIVTGTASRASFLEKAERKIALAQADGSMLGLLFIDLDGFKSVNDSLGFEAGDALLKAFSQDLVRRVRAGTLVARLGGDAFVVLLEGITDKANAGSIAKSIFDRLQTSFHVDKMPLHVTASAGLAIYPQDGDSIVTLLKNAGIATQSARQQGKNSCRFFNASMSDAADKALQINRSLGEALEKKQFTLAYQPKFNGRTNRITGAEALIRWVHPVLGNIPPTDFIPIAEQTGQIIEISEWVIGEVCRQLKIWERMGLSLPKISINLSPKQLARERYPDCIAALVTEAGIAPRSILFEITESVAMQDPKAAGEAIREFQRAGFDFSIDDFGTGYSSMAYLQQFRVKELKIDRFFINSLEDGGNEEHSIVAAVIALAHALHMSVVAEGVETRYQLNILNDLGCDEVQGYLLGRPMPPVALERLLREELLADERAADSRAQSASNPVLHSLTA